MPCSKCIDQLEELADDAKKLWIAYDENGHYYVARAEYQRGYMNAMHQAMGILESHDHGPKISRWERFKKWIEWWQQEHFIDVGQD